MPSQCDYTLWLVPVERQAAPLRELIASLARRCRTPRFAPHVTLLSCAAAYEDILFTLREVAARTPPLVLRCTDLADGDQYYRCVYARIADEPPLSALRASCLDLPGHNVCDAAYEPHLSLVYGNLTRSRRRDCKRYIEARRLPGALLRIDRIGIIRLAERPEDWQTAATVALNGEQ